MGGGRNGVARVGVAVPPADRADRHDADAASAAERWFAARHWQGEAIRSGDLKRLSRMAEADGDTASGTALGETIKVKFNEVVTGMGGEAGE